MLPVSNLKHQSHRDSTNSTCPSATPYRDFSRKVEVVGKSTDAAGRVRYQMSPSFHVAVTSFWLQGSATDMRPPHLRAMTFSQPKRETKVKERKRSFFMTDLKCLIVDAEEIELII
jgi:hypothetical protein